MNKTIKKSLTALLVVGGVEAISCSDNPTKPFEQGLNCGLQDTLIVTVNDQRTMRFHAEGNAYSVRVLKVRPEPEGVPNPGSHITSYYCNGVKYVSRLYNDGMDIDRLYLSEGSASTHPRGDDEAILDIVDASGYIPPIDGQSRGYARFRFIRCR